MRETLLIKNYLSFKVCHNYERKYDWLVNLSANNTASLVIAFSIFAARGFKNKSLLCSKTLPLKQSDNCVLLYYSSVFASNFPALPIITNRSCFCCYTFFCYTEQLLHYNDHSVCVCALFSYYYKDDKNTHTCSVKRTASAPTKTHTFREMQQKHRDSFMYVWRWGYCNNSGGH